MNVNKIYMKSSECMNEIDDNSVDLVVTSPPYNIDINYGNKMKNGRVIESKGIKYSDKLPEDEYRKMLEKVFKECKRVLKETGSIFVNIKNRYDKDRIITPFWIEEYFKDMYLKNVIIWNFDWGGSTSKRFAPRYEYIYWFTKHKSRYKFNLDDVKIPALNYRPDRYKSLLKNPSDVWRISMVSGNSDERTAHPAQYPESLIKRIVLCSTDKGDVVLDPFMGSGTSAVVAKKLNRNYLGYELQQDYIDIANARLESINTNSEEVF